MRIEGEVLTERLERFAELTSDVFVCFDGLFADLREFVEFWRVWSKSKAVGGHVLFFCLSIQEKQNTLP